MYADPQAYLISRISIGAYRILITVIKISYLIANQTLFFYLLISRFTALHKLNVSNHALVTPHYITSHRVPQQRPDHRTDPFVAFAITDCVADCAPNDSTEQHRRIGPLVGRIAFNRNLFFPSLLDRKHVLT